MGADQGEHGARHFHPTKELLEQISNSVRVGIWPSAMANSPQKEPWLICGEFRRGFQKRNKPIWLSIIKKDRWNKHQFQIYMNLFKKYGIFDEFQWNEQEKNFSAFIRTVLKVQQIPTLWEKHLKTLRYLMTYLWSHSRLNSWILLKFSAISRRTN